MTWIVETIDASVDAELAALPNDQKAKFAWIAKLIHEHGLPRIREPYVKYLGKGLWEIRMKGRDGISRALFVVEKPRRVVVVRVFVKKTQATPRREMQLALKRAERLK